MAETIQVTSSVPLFDVSGVSFLRKQLGHAATALKIIGIWSALFVLVLFESAALPSAFLIALLTPGCAFLIAKRLRSGRTWAVMLATIWLVLYTVQALYALQKMRAGFDFYSVLGWIALLAPTYFLARGLIAFAAYRARGSKTRMVAGLLALNPYEEGPQIKKRPKLLNKQRVAVYGLLILAPLPPLVLLLSRLQPQNHVYFDEPGLLGAWIATAFVFLAVLAWAARIYRRGRRAAMLPGSALMKKDTRPIVLYLRSFQDDSKIKIRARAANGRILLERLVKIPFEEVVTDHLWGYGPVLAIGNPQMKSKPALLGAARDYVDDSTWQQKVSDLIHDAAMVVVVAGGTEGLAWEIDTIARLGSIWKLVLLFPPVNVHELQTRWQALASHVRGNILPAQIDFAQARAVIFPKGQPVLITGTKGDDWTYEAAVDEAALTIASERHSNHPAASPERALRAGRVREVLGRVASDLASMLAAAFMLVLFVVAYAASQYRESITRPFAADTDQRKQFMAEMMRVCQESNSQLSAEKLAKYCSCFTSDLADAVTLLEFNKVDTDPSAFQAKGKSVSGACSEKTLGQ